MAELTVKTKQDEQKTIAADLGEAGVHIYTDEDYFQRRKKIETHFTVEDGDLTKLNLSASREFILKRTYAALKFVSAQGTAGLGGESGKFYKGMTAVRNLCQRNIEDLMFSSASDDEVGLPCLDRLAKVEQIVQATFRKDNTTVQKTFTVHSAMPGNTGKVVVESHESSPD